MPRVRNRNCRPYVERRESFQGSNLWGEWNAEGSRYIVYSYGHHFPLYVWDDQVGKWFGNESKISVSTSRHRSQAMPRNAPIEWKDQETLLELAALGVVGLVRSKISQAAGVAVEYFTM